MLGASYRSYLKLSARHLSVSRLHLSTAKKMTQSYIVRFKDTVPDNDYQKAKEDVKTKGGSIKHEYVLFKGFTAELPDDHVGTLSAHPHIDQVERDQEVKISG